MDTFVIQGGQKLSGSIPVMGAKNAAGPIIAACALISGQVTLSNVPRILDIERLIEILKSMKAKVTWRDDHTVTIDCSDLDPSQIDHTNIKKIRLSILLLGSLAQRFGEVTIPIPGGCRIGTRPVDAHFKAFEQLGFTCKTSDEQYSITKTGKPRSEIVLFEMSPTATANVILASVIGTETVRLFNACSDYQVQDLCHFLNKAGAKISGVGTSELVISGVESLSPCDFEVIHDPIEAGTFIILAAASKGTIEIENVPLDFFRIEKEILESCGIEIKVVSSKKVEDRYTLGTVIPKRHSLKSIRHLKCMPYPGFMPDLLQPLAVLLTQADGSSLLHDWMYDGRFSYVNELKKMGANINMLDPHRVLIVGPTSLYGKEITGYDLRAGATLVIAGLIAEGETTLHGINQVDRGYEKLDERLQQLGASIKRM